MDVINFTSLNNINHDHLPTSAKKLESIKMSMTQPYHSDMCGAYALVAAATTFGFLSKEMDEVTIQNIELFPEGHSNLGSRKRLNESETFNQWADNVYCITAVLPSDSDTNANTLVSYQYGNYNDPAAMIMVAKQLGFNVKLRISKELNFSDSMRKRCAYALQSQDAISTDNFGQCPDKGVIAISLMSIIAVGKEATTEMPAQHWIARSSDNTYFDSLRDFYAGNQFGRVGKSWSSRPYIDTGMEILLSK
jgi:hypothetical protein